MDGLRAEGKMLANGPFRDQQDQSLRGLCVMAVGVDEARELMHEDPSVRAGRLAPEVFVWMIPVGLASFGGLTQP
jgi:uncharacterized protein